MSFAKRVQELQRQCLFLPAFLFLAWTGTAQAQTFISDRTMADMDNAENDPRWQAELAALGKPVGIGCYVDASGNPIFYRLVHAPTGGPPGAKYPLYIGAFGPHPLAFSSSQVDFPCYVVQAGGAGPGGKDWKRVHANGVKVIIERLMAAYGNIDASRIYSGGHSANGGAAWAIACYHPDVIAAIIPNAATMPDLAYAPLVASKHIGVWMFQGVHDNVYAKSVKCAPHIVDAMVAAGAKPLYTQYTFGGHRELWWTDSLTNPAWNDFTRVRQWLFAQHKPTASCPTITSPTTAIGVVGAPFHYAISAANAPMNYAVDRMIAPPLPAGLSIDPNTGVISGTPTAPGLSFVTLNATNASGTGVSMLELFIKDSGPVMEVRRATVFGEGGTDSVSGSAAGCASALNYTIANKGNAVLTLTGAPTISRWVNCTTTVSNPVGTLAAGATTSLVVTVTPIASGHWTFEIALVNDQRAPLGAPMNAYDWIVWGTATATQPAATVTGASPTGGATAGGLTGNARE